MKTVYLIVVWEDAVADGIVSRLELRIINVNASEERAACRMLLRGEAGPPAAFIYACDERPPALEKLQQHVAAGKALGTLPCAKRLYVRKDAA